MYMLVVFPQVKCQKSEYLPTFVSLAVLIWLRSSCSSLLSDMIFKICLSHKFDTIRTFRFVGYPYFLEFAHKSRRFILKSAWDCKAPRIGVSSWSLWSFSRLRLNAKPNAVCKIHKLIKHIISKRIILIHRSNIHPISHIVYANPRVKHMCLCTTI